MKKPAAVFAAVALTAILIWGLEQAAIAPLQTGEIYPPYSSLRSDPLGAKALYESVGALGSIEVERLYRQRERLDARDTMLVMGVDAISWSGVSRATLAGYEKLVSGGGRLVIAFLPMRSPRRIPEKREAEVRWNVKLRYTPRGGDSSSAIPRDTSLFFEAGPEWRAIRQGAAIERPFGSGSIVLAADTFPLSNEGLAEARDANYIAALIGPSSRLIFDENHFGVVDSGSVTKLMHKYHLEGALAVLAIAAALFLWRSATSFLPPRATAVNQAVAGRDSIEGMAALLHRGVAEKDLIDVCFAEWSRGSPPQSRTPRVEEEIRRLKHDAVAAYRAASKTLSEKP